MIISNSRFLGKPKASLPKITSHDFLALEGENVV